MRTALLGLAFAALLVAAGWFMPKWLTFLITMAAANGMVSLGIVMLMRAGVVPFGQGMVFAIGGYTAALAFNRLGITDALLLTLAGGVAATLVAAPFAPLLARYRGIFFAMLTLALSMVVYGLLTKTSAVGGSDGFNMGRPTVLGWRLPDAHTGYVMYAVTLGIATLGALLARRYFDSTRGLLTLAVRDNELRVEYLGASVRNVVHVNYVIAAALGGVGGGLTALAVGHIDPDMAYWTTSGEFIFITILAGTKSVVAPFLGALIFGIIHTVAFDISPNTWQMTLGIALLLVIVFLPDGLWSLFSRRKAA